MDIKLKHGEILDRQKESYWDVGLDPEFIYDGPSHWDKYEESNPRIVFLAKEAHSSFAPSEPRVVDDRFTRNIARWAYLINAHGDSTNISVMPESDKLQEYYNRIAIVEVKKVNEDKKRSSPTELKDYAWKDQFYLKRQIEILSPHVVLCCGTLDYFDIIFDYTYEVEKKIYSNSEVACWLVNDMLVIDFYHPSTTKKGNTDNKLFKLLTDLLSNQAVQSNYSKIINNKI